MASKTRYASVCGMQFAGDTVAAAKANGEREVTRLAREANLGPSAYQVGTITVLVWPTLETWSYTLMGGPTNMTAPNGIVHASCTMGGTRWTASLSAIAHAAQWQWSHDVSDDEAYFAQAFDCIDATTDDKAAALRSDIREQVYRAQWHRRYKAALEVCGDRNWSHDVATRTPTIDEARTLATREAA